MKTLLLLASAALVFAQSDSPVNTISAGDPNAGYQNIYVFTGTNLIYHCKAASRQDTQTLPTISAATNANPVVLTITAHAFDYQALTTSTPTITITGGTGSWAGINGTWTFTPTGANTGTIPVDSTAFGALAGTFVVTSRAPRTTALKWSIIHYAYDASNNLIWSGWATDPTRGNASVGSPAAEFACASRTTYGYQ
jgi:hypothetical protein